MKILHLSTWKCKCGIAEYLELLTHYLDLEGVDQFVLGNCLTSKSRIPDYKSIADRILSMPVFCPVYLEGMWWNAYDTTLHRKLEDEAPDLLHIQLQTNLYECEWLNSVMEAAQSLNIRVAATFHDSGVWGRFHWPNLDGAAAHRADTMAHFSMPEDRKQVLPRGIPTRPLRLCSFAFGRNDHARVKIALNAIGIEFNVQDPFRDGWLSHEDLIEWISKHDAAVLWYPETEASVSSGALRTALAARRPVYVSDTSWFREAESDLVLKFHDFDTMINCIRADFSDPMIENFAFEKVAREHIAWYEKLIAAGQRPGSIAIGGSP